MVTFVLKRKWFEKIESGEKTIEFRAVKKHWTSRIMVEGAELEPIAAGYLVKNTIKKCVLTCGYTANKLYSDIEKIEIWNNKKNDLEESPCYAIYLKNVRKTE